VDAQPVTRITSPLFIVGNLVPSTAFVVVVIDPIFDRLPGFIDGIEWQHFHLLFSKRAVCGVKSKSPLGSGERKNRRITCKLA
jgi:hypothetical protein